MTNAKRGRGTRRGFYFCAVAALGFALSGCGGGSGPAGATTSQASTGLGNTSANANLPTGGSSGVTINWQPPTENTDGSPLTNLSGYDIHYGTASHAYTQTISVTNPGLASYVVENLTPGTYYFAVAAVNSAGTESPLSAEVGTKVN